jgi:orotidine-5'-phosphate decarboxylase
LLDVKLSDIGSTNTSSCFWIREAGFDAITASPFPGNIASLWADCKKRNLGLFLLCLMSNPEAGMFMKSRIGEEIAYAAIAKEIAKEGITGAVVGATIDDGDARSIAGLLPEALALIPGIGAQQGGTEVLRLFGERSVVNVSRGVIFADDPGKKAKEYRDQIARICL